MFPDYTWFHARLPDIDGESFERQKGRSRLPIKPEDTASELCRSQ
jgi:hypothetical protein